MTKKLPAHPNPVSPEERALLESYAVQLENIARSINYLPLSREQGFLYPPKWAEKFRKKLSLAIVEKRHPEIGLIYYDRVASPRFLKKGERAVSVRCLRRGMYYIDPLSSLENDAVPLSVGFKTLAIKHASSGPTFLAVRSSNVQYKDLLTLDSIAAPGFIWLPVPEEFVTDRKTGKSHEFNLIQWPISREAMSKDMVRPIIAKTPVPFQMPLLGLIKFQIDRLTKHLAIITRVATRRPMNEKEAAAIQSATENIFGFDEIPGISLAQLRKILSKANKKEREEFLATTMQCGTKAGKEMGCIGQVDIL